MTIVVKINAQMTKPDIHLRFCVDENADKKRLDSVLSRKIEGFSRSQVQNWIVSDYVKIDEKICNKAKQLLKKGQIVQIDAPLPKHTEDVAQKQDLDIIHEDEHILIIFKPAGWVVHPGAGNRDGTLMNALLYHCPDATQLPRAGIVHRLDKDTSGIMMVAKTPLAYQYLTQELAARNVHRHYYAIVDGILKRSQTIHTHMGRHPISRVKMAVVNQGKEAITHVKIAQFLQGYTLIEATLDTGRTHQIRVHMQHIGHPILGDKTYGKHKGFRLLPPSLSTQVQAMPRQALHAYKLTLPHPKTHKEMTFTCPIPPDMQSLIDALSS